MATGIQKSSPTAVRLWTAAIVVYFVTAIGYVIYETITSRGITGYIEARQIEWFGNSSVTVAFCLAFAVVTVIPLILALVLGATVVPSLGAALWSIMVNKPKSGVPPPQVQAKSAAEVGFTWPGILKFMAVMFGLTVAIAGVLYFLNVREQALGVYKLDLDHAPPSLPDRIGFIQITGHLSQSQALTYHDNTSVYLVAPIVPSNWSPANSLRYFVHYHQLGNNSRDLTPPTEFHNPGVATFGGQVQGKLPVFIERAYSQKGLKLDPDYKLIEWQQLYAGELPLSNTHLVVLIIGGLISVSLSAVLIGIKIRQPA